MRSMLPTTTFTTTADQCCFQRTTTKVAIEEERGSRHRPSSSSSISFLLFLFSLFHIYNQPEFTFVAAADVVVASSAPISSPPSPHNGRINQTDAAVAETEGKLAHFSLFCVLSLFSFLHCKEKTLLFSLGTGREGDKQTCVCSCCVSM